MYVICVFIFHQAYERSHGRATHYLHLGTTLNICMSALPLGETFSSLLTKKTTMFTVYVDMRILIDKALKQSIS